MEDFFTLHNFSKFVNYLIRTVNLELSKSKCLCSKSVIFSRTNHNFVLYDLAEHKSVKHVGLLIEDVNNNKPVFTRHVYNAYIYENEEEVKIKDRRGILAVDRDSEEISPIRYSALKMTIFKTRFFEN